MSRKIINPEKLLDTKIVLNNKSVVTTQVYRKENKKAVPWVSKIPKRYKQNTISGYLHISRKIASKFNIRIRAIKAKYNKNWISTTIYQNYHWISTTIYQNYHSRFHYDFRKR